MTNLEIVKAYILDNNGSTKEEIAEATGVKYNTVVGSVQKLKKSGEIPSDSVAGKKKTVKAKVNKPQPKTKVTHPKITKLTKFDSDTEVSALVTPILKELSEHFGVPAQSIKFGRLTLKNDYKVTTRVTIKMDGVVTKYLANQVFKLGNLEALSNMNVKHEYLRGTIGHGSLKLSVELTIKDEENSKFSKATLADYDKLKSTTSTKVKYTNLGDQLTHPRLGLITIVNVKLKNRKYPIIVETTRGQQYKLATSNIDKIVTEDMITDYKLTQLGL